VKVDGLQAEYSLEHLVEPITETKAFEQLQKTIGRLQLAISTGDPTDKLLADIVIKLKVDLSAAIYKRMMTDHREGRLKR